MSVQVVPLRPDEWRQAGAMLARAFAADPVRRVLYPDDATRPEKLAIQFQMGIRQAVVDGMVVDTTPSLGAVAVWVPPGRPTSPSLRAVLANAPLTLRWLRVVRWGDLRRASGLLRRYEQRHRRLRPSPHWYLEMLGVEPARQRFGLGAAVVLHGLGRADRDGLPAYVETETAGNAAFYGKLGFRVVHRTSAEDEPLGVPTWCLVRDPRHSPAPAYAQLAPEPPA